MATQIKEMYDKVINFATNHENSLISTLTIIAVYVIQRVSFENAFQCPCDHTWAKFYGACILLCPAFILGMLSMMYHQFLWRRVKRTGLCCPSPACGESVLRASLPFFSWIILVMVDGEVADCFFQVGSDCSTPPESSNNEKGIATTTTTSSLTDVLKPMGNTSEKAISQLLGLIVALLYVFAALMCLFQKRKSKSYRDKFLKEHEKHEENELLKGLQEKAEEIAKSDVCILMANIETLKDDDWKKMEQQPYKKSEQQTGNEVVMQIDKDSLSGLHKLVKKKRMKIPVTTDIQTQTIPRPPPKVEPRVIRNPEVEPPQACNSASNQ